VSALAVTQPQVFHDKPRPFMTKRSASVVVFASALVTYWGTAVYFGKTQTPDTAYFNQLADAFLHGRLDLEHPRATLDLTEHHGRWYVPFPPLPALLMLPWVALGGLSNMNTVLFCAILGALNVALVHWLLQQLSQHRWTKLTSPDNLWLTALFGIGCVHWYIATTGSVWFVAQICTVTFIALSVCIAAATNVHAGSASLAGMALGLAMVGRPTVALTWPLLLGIGATQLQAREGKIVWPSLARWAIASAIPMTLAVIGLLTYNNARFDNPLDFGYLNENVADKLKGALHTHGQFSLRYVPRNLWAMSLAWRRDGQGLSLLLTTPALVYLYRARSVSPLMIGAWTALALLLVPLLLYYNTGYFQFGYRFSLDFMVPVMVLLALAAGERTSWSMRALILAGVLVNLYGVFWWHVR
jgi:hypothetical protein